MSPHPLITIAAVVVPMLLPLSARAQIYKCEGPDGVVEYSNAEPPAKPGRKCKTIDVGPITVIPAPKPSPRPAPASATEGRSPKDFPKVDSATQRARDEDRRRIVEDELQKEEAHLDALRKEYNNGEPERLGSERNYQKYLDRVQRLKDDIARSEGNIETLRRELSGLRR